MHGQASGIEGEDCIGGVWELLFLWRQHQTSRSRGCTFPTTFVHYLLADMCRQQDKTTLTGPSLASFRLYTNYLWNAAWTRSILGHTITDCQDTPRFMSDGRA